MSAQRWRWGMALASGGGVAGGLGVAGVEMLRWSRGIDPQRPGFAQMPRSNISRICRLMTFSRYSACFMGARLR